MALFNPAQAIWKQRLVLAARAAGLRQLRQYCKGGDLRPHQWPQLLAFALEFRPNLILELGRGTGNSTCCFLEAAACLPDCRMVSLCLSTDWDLLTGPRLAALRPPEWFAPGRFLKQDILQCDFAQLLGGAERVLVFWDAHGFDVAECVLGGLLPLLASRRHLVIMHDLSDLRYCHPSRAYGRDGVWKPHYPEGDGASLFLGHINTHVGQAIAILDFCTRNRLALHSADESLHAELAGEPADTLRQLLGDELFSLRADLFWFTLNDTAGPFTFPAFVRPAAVEPLVAPVAAPRSRSLLRRIVGGVVRRARRVLAAAAG